MTEKEPNTNLWRFVLGDETSIANHLQAIAQIVPAELRHQIQLVAKRIERSSQGGDSEVQRVTLGNPEVLSVLSPLLERAAESQNSKTLNEGELFANLQMGVCRLTRYRAGRKSIVSLFAYPGLLMVGIIGIMVFFSQYIAPNIEQVVDEFGIELPGPTKAVFGLSQVFQTAWPLAVLIALLATLPMIVELCRSLGVVPRFVQWCDNRLSGRRLVMATWAHHTALLLQSRIDQDVAVKSSMAAVEGWLRSGTLPWRLGLLEETLKLDDRHAKIALLNQTADYYCAYHRSWVQWWASFLPTILVCLLGGFLLLVMIAIFVPLLYVFRGLSGGLF